MTQKEFLALIQKYKAGKATLAERELIEKWYNAIGNDEQPHMSIAEEQALERQFQGHAAHYTAPQKENKPRMVSLRWTTAIAASLLLVWAFYFYSVPSGTQLPGSIPVPSAKETGKLFTVTADKVQHVLLADGSTVVLQPGSVLTYDEQGFGDTRREVFLKGEGFFEVARDTTKPFYVFSGDVATTVLGTSFTVKTVNFQKQIVVAVNTGRVAVATKQSELFGLKQSFKQETVLTPNQQATFNTEKKILSTSLVDAPQIVSPEDTPGKMEFDDVALPEIFEALEKAFQVDISFDPKKIGTCAVTVKLDKENLFERLDIICRAAGAQYEVSGTRIIIKKESCR